MKPIPIRRVIRAKRYAHGRFMATCSHWWFDRLQSLHRQIRRHPSFDGRLHSKPFVFDCADAMEKLEELRGGHKYECLGSVPWDIYEKAFGGEKP